MPLTGIRVLDLSTILAGPFAATLLADFGADVIKVEHPRGDPLRGHGHAKNGHGLLWKQMNRNKSCVTLDLSKAHGQEILLMLASKSDVLIENFRPGVMERWSLGYDRLSERNLGLVMLRMTGFGQFGPYSDRPGFGTLAESMSGFAHVTGEADGPPTLPPFGLADGIAGLAGALGVMMALFRRGSQGGKGQVVDIAIIEPILMVLGAQPLVFDQLGIVQSRMGNRSINNAPRNTYKTHDGRWVAVSSSADSIAARLMEVVGHRELVQEPWFKTGGGRAEHGEELDAIVAEWIGEHGFDEVISAFQQAGAAVAPIYDASQVLDDPQYAALHTFVSLDDPDIGPMRMQNVIMRLLDTPGSVRFAGRRLGEDNDAVYSPLGLDVERLRAEGVI